MTLVPDREKKPTSLDVYASTEEREMIGKALDIFKDRLVYDSDTEKILFPQAQKGGQKAITVKEATDPLTYIKLHNFIDKLGKVLKTETAAAEILLPPNILDERDMSKEVRKNYDKDFDNYRKMVNNELVKKKDENVRIFGSAVFEPVSLVPLSDIDGIKTGESMLELLEEGKIVPEYGITKLYSEKGRRSPLAFWDRPRPVAMNRAYVLVVKNDNPKDPINEGQQVEINDKAWDALLKGNLAGAASEDVTSAYGSMKDLKPKDKGALLDLMASLAVAENEGLIGVRPIIRRQSMNLVDPEDDEAKNYWVFTIGGYKEGRGGVYGNKALMRESKALTPLVG